MRCTAAIISETAEIAVAFVVLTEHKCWLGRISFSGTIIGRKCQLYFCISSHSVWFHRSVSCWKAFVFALKTERWIFGCIFIIVWSTAVDIKLTNILKLQIQNLMVVGFDLFLFSSSSIYDKNKWGTKEKSGQRQIVNDRDFELNGIFKRINFELWVARKNGKCAFLYRANCSAIPKCCMHVSVLVFSYVNVSFYASNF